MRFLLTTFVIGSLLLLMPSVTFAQDFKLDSIPNYQQLSDAQKTAINAQFAKANKLFIQVNRLRSKNDLLYVINSDLKALIEDLVEENTIGEKLKKSRTVNDSLRYVVNNLKKELKTLKRIGVTN